MVLVLVGCGDPGPGEPGYEGCDPIPLDRTCLVWSCYQVFGERSIELWYEYDIGDGIVTVPCDELDCAKALAEASSKGCP